MKPEVKLIIVKSIHSLIWIIMVTIIAFVLWSGFTSIISSYTWFAIAAVLIETLVLAIFKGSCPLTVVARRYSDSTNENFDIYLPNWLAKYNKQIFGTLFLIGLGLVLFHYFD
jgi:hypothetical protein